MLPRHLPLPAVLAFALALWLTPTSAQANFSDCFLDVPAFGFDSITTPGGPSDVSICTIQLPSVGASTPQPNESAYVDAQHSYQTVQTAFPGPQPTQTTSQGTFIEIGFNDAPLDSRGAVGAAGSQIGQTFFATRTGGAGFGSGFIRVEADFRITLEPDANSVYTGAFGINIAGPTGGFDPFFVEIDSNGNTSMSPGFTIVDLGDGIFEVQGTVDSSSFSLPTDGSPFDYFIVAFGEGIARPSGSTSVSNGRILIDSSNTVTSTVVSLDPNVQFNLGSPLASPEPALLLLVVAGGASVLSLRRGRR